MIWLWLSLELWLSKTAESTYGADTLCQYEKPFPPWKFKAFPASHQDCPAHISLPVTSSSSWASHVTSPTLTGASTIILPTVTCPYTVRDWGLEPIWGPSPCPGRSNQASSHDCGKLPDPRKMMKGCQFVL